MKFQPGCRYWGLVAALLLGCSSAPQVRQSTAARALTPVVVSARFGYQLTLRDASWRPIRASSISPSADLALEHGGGDAVLLVFAERADRMRLDEFVRHSRSTVRMVSGAPASWTSAETVQVPLDAALVPAWLIERQVVRYQLLRYTALVTVGAGIGYNVVCWGSGRNPELPRVCREILDGFRLSRTAGAGVALARARRAAAAAD